MRLSPFEPTLLCGLRSDGVAAGTQMGGKGNNKVCSHGQLGTLPGEEKYFVDYVTDATIDTRLINELLLEHTLHYTTACRVDSLETIRLHQWLCPFKHHYVHAL